MGWNNPEREKLSPISQMSKVGQKVKGSTVEARLESGLSVKAALTSECGWGPWRAIALREGACFLGP